MYVSQLGVHKGKVAQTLVFQIHCGTKIVHSSQFVPISLTQILHEMQCNSIGTIIHTLFQLPLN